jgi:predicted amidohydrolase YtcJ
MRQDRPVTTLITNARVFTADPARPWADSFAVTGDRFTAVGTGDEVREALAASGADATEPVDLDGALVVPGFIDGHFHTISTGEALQRVDLVHAKSLPEIQRLVRRHAEAHPDDEWVLGKSWLFDAVPGGRPTAAMIDQVVADRPVLLDANDYHSAWVNTAALRMLGIDADSPDPVGGRIDRDPGSGAATGFLEENAAGVYAWDHLERITDDATRLRHLRAAIEACNAAGVTGVVDMAMRDADLAAMATAEAEGWLGLRVVGHWVMDRGGTASDHLDRVQQVAELSQSHRTDRLRIAGIKIWVDGVIDGCTAAMVDPFTSGAHPDALWEADALNPVVAAADAAGLQVAMHAIGDRAVRLALDAVEHAQRTNGTTGRRHRIEHIETVAASDLDRFGQLGVTASMQPVHADPAIQPNWAAMLGAERSERGFPWPELVAGGARLVFGTDAPTAPYAPLPNLFIAATRRSALDPDLAPTQPSYALALEDAMRAATASAAWSVFDEDVRGRLATGLLADFAVVHPDVFLEAPDALLQAQVLITVLGGRTVHRSA